MRNYLEALRRDKGITQEDLARTLDVTRQTIISLEKGHYNPSIHLAFRIARYFNRKVEDVFIYEEDHLGK